MKNNKFFLFTLGVILVCILVSCSNKLPTQEISKTFTPSVEATATKETVQPASTEETIQEVEFNLSKANTVPPEDILEETVYYGGGGGFDSSICVQPTTLFAPDDNELMTLEIFVVCGISKSELLTGKIVYPDGRELIQDIQTELVEGTYWGKLAFKPKIDDPVGIYTFSLEDDKFKLEAKVYYRLPDGPRLLKLDNDHILFYGFAPQERVKLVFYESRETEWGWHWKFRGWDEYKMDDSGQAKILVSIGQGENEFENPELFYSRWSYTFVAFGEETGEVRLLHHGPYGGGFSLIDGETQKKPNACEGLLSRLFYKAQARVAFTNGAKMRIRDNPGFSQKIDEFVPEGTRLKVFLGPVCADGSTWWFIITEKDLRGWMAEYQGDTYLLEPIQ